ncbi:MAG: hypothetical protein ACKESB_03350 [Candidatus Hodgkinia cicadicola]
MWFAIRLHVVSLSSVVVRHLTDVEKGVREGVGSAKGGWRWVRKGGEGWCGKRGNVSAYC